MKTKTLLLFALLAPSVFAAEYLHLRNERKSAVSYTIEGIPGIQKIILQPKESISLRFASDKQKVELVIPSGTSSFSGGRVFIVEANESLELGSISENDLGSYPILLRVIETMGAAEKVKISEMK